MDSTIIVGAFLNTIALPAESLMLIGARMLGISIKHPTDKEGFRTDSWGLTSQLFAVCLHELIFKCILTNFVLILYLIVYFTMYDLVPATSIPADSFFWTYLPRLPYHCMGLS